MTANILRLVQFISSTQSKRADTAFENTSDSVAELNSIE